MCREGTARETNHWEALYVEASPHRICGSLPWKISSQESNNYFVRCHGNAEWRAGTFDDWTLGSRAWRGRILGGSELLPTSNQSESGARIGGPGQAGR